MKTKLLMTALAAATITAPVPALSQDTAAVYSTFVECDDSRAEARRTLATGMKGRVLGQFNKLYNATYQCEQTSGLDTEDTSDDAFMIVAQ